MKLKGIMSIAGYHGLYKLVSQGKNSIIVESLIDGKRMPAFYSYKISALEDIAIYTEEKEIPLKDVFKLMLDKLEKKPTLDIKAPNNELIKVFTDFIPNYDKNRVYVSDIKKVFSWYNLLLDKDLLNIEEEVEASETTEKNAEKTESKETANEVEKVKEVAKTVKATKSNKTSKPKETKTAKPISKPKTQSKVSSVKKTGNSGSSK